ncbi:MAG: hypothetical protein C5B49_15395 [Bdellovibrio sp.]|nr:MAG: hypothetical protein C5B49_15395 [Bdellovibrio sp.]
MVGLETHLKIMLWNVENLFLLSDQLLRPEQLKLDEIQWQKLSNSIYSNKSLAKTKALAEVIRIENPDLILLCEVGGLESLQNFNRLFLGDRYSPALLEGNSDRSIDVGFLTRRGVGFYFDLVSNKNRVIKYIHPDDRDSESPRTHRFSRDAAELHLFLDDREKPFLIFLLTHLKSQLDPDHIDPMGFERRQAEFEALLSIYEDLRRRFAKNPVPIAVCGDFNGNAGPVNTDREFQMLYQTTKLEDVCELAKVLIRERATYYQVGRSPGSEGRQIDYCFLSPELKPHLVKESVRVFRYKDEDGFPLDPPSTMEAKLKLPSDHYPLLFELVNLPMIPSKVSS